MKKIFLVLLGTVMMFIVLASCGSNSETVVSETRETATMTVVDENGEETQVPVNDVHREEVDFKKVADLFDVDSVELESGATVTDMLNSIDYDKDIIEAVTYGYSSVDFNTPGDYTMTITIAMPTEEAEKYAGSIKFEDSESTDTVNLITEIPVTIT